MLKLTLPPLLTCLLAFAPPAQAQGPGFGIEVRFDGSGLRVRSVVPQSLAQRSGVRAGDLIFAAVDAQGRRATIPQLGAHGFSQLLRQPKFTLVLRRKGQRRPLHIAVRNVRTEKRPQPAKRSQASRPVPQLRPRPAADITSLLPPEVGARPAATRRSQPAARSAAETRTLVLEPRRLTDPGMGGIVSHTVLVPRGWTFRGGVRWTQSLYNYVHFVAAMESPGGASLHFDYNRSFQYSTADRRTGQTLPDGAVRMAPPRERGGIAAVLLRTMRPQARGIQIVRVKDNPAGAAQVREGLASLIQSVEQANRFDRNALGAQASQSQVWIRVESVRLRYTENGQAYEEEVLYRAFGTHTTLPAIRGASGMWNVDSTQTARAPVGQLDAQLGTLLSLTGCIRETPQWSVSLADLRAKISRIQHQTNMMVLREMARRARIVAETNRQLSDQRMAAWRQKQERERRTHRAVINSIVGVEDYRTADGCVVSVDSQFDRVFRDSAGNYLVSNDPAYDPRHDPSAGGGSWEQLERVDHFKD